MKREIDTSFAKIHLVGDLNELGIKIQYFSQYMLNDTVYLSSEQVEKLKEILEDWLTERQE